MTLFLIIVLALLLLVLLIGSLTATSSNGGNTSAMWVNALRNVTIALLIVLVVLAALPIVETALT